ncbi:AraC family transcriptional regulator [Lacticaseibacillus daqingensis]|uniref:AraC family transcriptional regulator n=1 Tax=Lacticaseibacillus daqingensis TaxID=2486014 RepID=UPI000F786966|nr:helix-turn-helix domain-containing protein [Lacticaseibacillus daqingensis]
MDITLMRELATLTPIEQYQQRNRIVCDDIPPDALDLTQTTSTQMPVLNDYFFRGSPVYISKHNRFAAYPLHQHQFLEINYMLRGQAAEVVDGQALTLHQGDILLLDVGSKHSIAAIGENDLLINILFRDRNLSFDLINQIQSKQSVLYDFLLNRLPAKTDPLLHVIFRQHDDEAIQGSIDSLIEEYYRKRDFSEQIISAELTVLLARLVRNYRVTPAPETKTQSIAIKMLEDIKRNYRDVSLEQLADHYCYNKNYLGNLFKKEVGKTFRETVTEERLIRANELIRVTVLPVSEIAQRVGISNTSFFYHKFQARFGHSPKQERDAAKTEADLTQTIQRF